MPRLVAPYLATNLSSVLPAVLAMLVLVVARQTVVVARDDCTATSPSANGPLSPKDIDLAGIERFSVRF